MDREQRIAVDCPGCGLVYQVLPPREDQRAKCRSCGHEFTIPATVVRRPRKPPPPGLAPSNHDRFSGATIATKMSDLSHERREPSRLVRWPLFVFLPVAMLGAAAIGMAVRWSDGPPKPLPPRQYLERGRVAKVAPAHTDFEYRTLADLIERVEPSVVQVIHERGLGSGFVLDPAGLIVTCHHCIEHANSAKVVFSDGREFEVAGVRAVSPGHDLAILEVKTTEPLPTIPLADNPPRKGEPVVAFGSPAGLAFTVSEGSIAALRKGDELSRIAEDLRGSGRLSLSKSCSLVQYAASTMPGNSGGPLVDFRGNVVGVAAFELPHRGKSFDFAIAYNDIQGLAESLNAKAVPLVDVATPAAAVAVGP